MEKKFVNIDEVEGLKVLPISAMELISSLIDELDKMPDVIRPYARIGITMQDDGVGIAIFIRKTDLLGGLLKDLVEELMEKDEKQEEEKKEDPAVNETGGPH